MKGKRINRIPKQMSEELNQNDSQEWLDENIDHDATPMADAGPAIAVKEREEVASDSVNDSFQAPHIVSDGGEEVVASEDAEPSAEGFDAVDRVNGLISSLETMTVAPAKASVLKSILKNVRASIDNAITLLDSEHGTHPHLSTEISSSSTDPVNASNDTPKTEKEAFEGVFSGSSMVGDDGKEYSVPPNYASKSKLVEGDMMKLYIGDRGNFIFKQVGPIERQRLVGTISFEQENGQYMVLAAGRSWKILKASVTYFKSEVGDEAVILVPKNAPSKWAAVENVIRRNPEESIESVL